VSGPIDRFASARGVAVLDDEGEHGYDDLRARASHVAAFLGDRRGKRVALLASPGADFVSALFGIFESGAAALVLSPLHPPAESAWFCEDADVDLVLHTRDQLERARGTNRPLVDLASIGASQSRAIAIDDASPALLLYTSGTTGRPKGAVLTHANLGTQQALLAEAWGLVSSDVLLHALPLHHMHGLCIALLSCLGAGATIRMLPAFDAERIFREMERSTVFMAVPTMYKKLLDAPLPGALLQNARKLRLATSGSSALPVTLAERWRAITGTIPLERFGMTEVGVGLSNPLHGERRAGTVGLPLRTVETRIEDSGELLIRGPSVFAEYFRREEATRNAFTDGWFKTGDTVAREASPPESGKAGGYFRILGRTSVDILKSGGYKLSALEIEEALREHTAVSDVAVVGVPDETWGDRVVACVVVRAGQTLAPEDLRNFAKEKLASYKCPKDVFVMDELPRNAMGKVQKPALVAMLAKNRE
jgi:malonyl-CoA/methylmalonyl-CoA synthetase